MSINYAVTKKVDKSKGIAKERYYATTRALQKKPVNSVQIANPVSYTHLTLPTIYSV